jgi:ABC-2 type transport system ATP-binding protein
MAYMTADAPDSVIAVHLNKTYEPANKKKQPPIVAVADLSLTVKEGEFFGFLGPNGAGKSTTIKMLCGMLRPTYGTVTVAGYSVADQPLEVKRVLGILPEEPSLYERLTGREFLGFAGRMHGIDKDEVSFRAEDLLRVMSLTPDADKMIVDYSMGMRKKIALAAALIHRPRVLFLDEPFNGIDPISVRAIRETLQSLADHGTTIFFSSHVMEVVEKLCDRVAIIQKGKLVGMGTLEELREQAGSDASMEDIFLTLTDSQAAHPEAISWL